MLVLTRGVGEKIVLGDDIEIVVTGIESGKVRLGFICPIQVRILRKEVHDDIQKNGPRKESQP